MYYLSSLNDWINGRTFNSLAEALATARKYQTGPQVDVMRRINRNYKRVVWTREGIYNGTTLRELFPCNHSI